MQSSEAVLTQARAALAHVPYHGQHFHPTINLRLSDGALILEGEVNGIADKVRAAARMRQVEGVSSVIDHLRIAGAPIGDGELRGRMCERLLQAVDFRSCKICAQVKGKIEMQRDAAGERSGWIEILVEDGMVTLRGHVISLSHKRLAGAMAWWAQGCRCVVNEIVVVPAEQDSDAEISEALRLVLESDGFVAADQIGIRVVNRVVTLDGYTGSAGMRKQAELDAWYIDGVEDVVNQVVLSS
jgi:osmotically-inducible protein OsmY